MPIRGSSNVESDSLELLLDTICNMFGGIVFISLLVALMIQTNEGQFDKPTEIIDPHQIELLEADLNLSKIQLDRVQQARKNQLDLIKKHVPSDLQQELDSLESLTNSHAKMEDQAEKARINNMERIKELNRKIKADGALLSDIDQLDQELSILEGKKSRLFAVNGVKMPLAKRRFRSQSIQISICYNRVYFRHDLDRLRTGVTAPNLDDYLVVSSDSTTIQVQPKPNAGIPLSDKSRARSMVLAQLRGFSNRDWDISITLRPDSHGAFRMVREIVADAGYHYSVLAIDEEIVDRGGSDRLSQ